MPYRVLASVLTLALLLAACAEATSDDDYAATHRAQDVHLTPDGNTMQYAQTAFSVKAGSTVTLTFENTATSSAMVHNVVLLTTDDDADLQRVSQAGMQAGVDSDYVPEDDAIHAATPLAQPGETVSITFTAPQEPGAYRYFCTFPGHASMMQGTMLVEES